MADIQIRLDDIADHDQWPQACLRCNGEPATLTDVPQKYRGGAESLTVPLCDAHRDHWQRFRRKNRIGSVIVIAYLILAAATVWLIFANDLWPAGLRGLQRFDVVGLSGFAGLLVIAIPLLIWIGRAPIRVIEMTSNRLTLSGVCKPYALAWWERQRMPIPPATGEIELRVGVEPYRPDGRAPYPGVVYLFVNPMLIGAIVGFMLGFVQRWLDTATANWDKHDSRYIVASACALFSYWIVVTSTFFRIGVRIWLTATFFGAIICLVFAGLGAFFVGLMGLGYAACLSFCLYLPVYLWFRWLIAETVKRHRIRRAWMARLASFAAMAALTAVLWLECGTSTPIALGVFFGLASAGAAAERANTPFCVGCESWMQKTHLGAINRPRSEVQPLVENGDISRLASLPVQQYADTGDVSFEMHSCPNCGEASTIILTMIDHIPNNKNKKRADARTVGRWIYPANVKPVLEELFPGEEGEREETAEDTK